MTKHSDIDTILPFLETNWVRVPRILTVGGEPVGNVAEPAHRKRDAISMARRQQDIAANEPISPVDLN